MANRIRRGDPRGFNKGRRSKFREGSRVWPEEGRRIYRGNNNSPKTLKVKNQQALSQKFRQLIRFKSPKHFYFKLFSLVNKAQWFQILLCTVKNSIKHQSFIYTQLKFKTVLFQAIQFGISTPFGYVFTIDRTLLLCYHLEPEWTREPWQ